MFNMRANAAVAVFWFAVFTKSVPAPMAVLKLRVLLSLSENKPTAVLYVPVVRLKSVEALSLRCYLRGNRVWRRVNWSGLLVKGEVG